MFTNRNIEKNLLKKTLKLDYHGFWINISKLLEVKRTFLILFGRFKLRY